MRASGQTRAQIVDIARELIQARSYLGFSFQDIADRVGLRKASLYHHFPSKESLGVAVLQQASQQFEAWFDKAAKTPQEKLDAYFRIYRDVLGAGSQVCPVGAVAAGWDCMDQALRDAGRQLRQVQVDSLAEVLMALGLPAQQAQDKAAYIFTVCQGAMLTARMRGDATDFDATVAELRGSLPR